MAAKKKIRKLLVHRKEQEEAIPPLPAKVVEVVPPTVEEKQTLCECGNPANPGSHQCWRCSHRS